MYEAAKELHVPHKNNGSLVVAFSKAEEETLQSLYERGLKNGIEKMQILSGEQARELEPNLSGEVTKALLVVTSSVRVANRDNLMVSVKTENPVPKSHLFDVMKQIRAAKTLAPVKIGDIIVRDVYGTNIVATKNID